MADKYETHERVFAKMKGYPAWPARIIERVAGKEEKYRIIFYGTNDEAIVKLDQLFRYNTETKAKYGKPQRQAQFKKAMEEIEAEIQAEANSEDSIIEAEKNNEDSEGELMIDEGLPSLPPTLTREVSKTESNESAGNKGKRPKSLAKRDSVSSASGIPTPVLTPSTPDVNQPTTEIVSRSGRKIKPKRFADDEITTPVVAGASKGTKANGSEDGGPPAKKAKRNVKSIGGKNATPIESSPAVSIEKEETPSKGRAAAAKGKNIAPAAKQSRLSPDISSPMNSNQKVPPSLLKAAPVKRTSSGNKQIPALVPTGQATKANLRKSERQTRSKSMEEPNDTDEPLEESNSGLPNETADENSESKESFDETQEEIESDNKSSSGDVKKHTNLEPEETPPDEDEKKIKVTGKNGLKYELSYELKKPDSVDSEDEEHIPWQAVAEENVEKLQEELAKSDLESQDIINSTAEVIEHLDEDEFKSREKRSVQIRLLRLEGEVIEIIGEIVGCLSVHNADCPRAIELLERLEGHQLNVLMLKKHPEVVETIKKLRCYVGNVEAWNFSEKKREEFELEALQVRQKAVLVYKHFQDLFCTNPDEVFIKVFRDEVKKFKASVQGLPMKTILGLTEEEETGELQEFEMDMNGDLDGIEPDNEA